MADLISADGWLAEAENMVSRIGGFNGDGVDELGPAAIACALIGVGKAILLLNEAYREANEPHA